MTVRKWGIQKFLNRPADDDNGFLVGWIQPVRTKYYAGGFNASLTVADCDRRSHLDFSPESLRHPVKDKPQENLVEYRQALDSIKQRRAKVKILRDVVNEFCDKVDEGLDDFEETARNLYG